MSKQDAFGFTEEDEVESLSLSAQMADLREIEELLLPLLDNLLKSPKAASIKWPDRAKEVAVMREKFLNITRKYNHAKSEQNT